MPAYPRKLQKVFGGGLAAVGNVGVIGSGVAGVPAYSTDLTVIQSLAAFLNGFQGITIGNRSPAIEEMTSLFLMVTQQLAYILQNGIPEWEATETYYLGAQCRAPGTGAVFTSITNNNTANDPLVSAANWASGAGAYQANINTGGAQVTLINTLGQLIQFNSAVSNPFGSFNVATYKYTAPVRGDYQVAAMLQVDNVSAVAGSLDLSLRAVKTGGVPLLVGGENGPSGIAPVGSRWYPKLMGQVTLAAGETLEIQLAGNDGVNTGSVTVSNSYLTISRK